jgi:hypothetical protein
MSRSNMYAEVVDLAPVLAMMNEHADQGLPFIALEYDDGYQEETQEGTSTMPSLDEIESQNLDGINVLEPDAWRHLLSIATEIVGLTFGTGGPGVSVRTSDCRNGAVVPVTRETAYKPMSEIERKIFEAGMQGAHKTEPIGEVLGAFGAEPDPKDEL